MAARPQLRRFPEDTMPDRIPDKDSNARGTVAVIGAGSIGVSWAIVFARAGRAVRLHDPSAERLDASGTEVRTRLVELAGAGLLEEDPGVVAGRVSRHADAADAVAGADHLQECAPEELELKRALFTELERAAAPDAVLASSTSALLPSEIFAHLKARERCLIAHPVNPPHLLPVVELVGASFTEPATVDRTQRLLDDVGMSPIRVRREIEGFVLNRLQGALLREAYCLVRDGVASVDEVDQVVRDGLGRRWALMGPFETVDVNTRGGIAQHALRMGPAYERMGAERGQHDPWTPGLVQQVERERRELLPEGQWEQRVAWRDHMLLALEEMRRRHDRCWSGPAEEARQPYAGCATTQGDSSHTVTCSQPGAIPMVSKWPSQAGRSTL
jgi:L-gulonate 3-dehydrogenase